MADEREATGPEEQPAQEQSQEAPREAPAPAPQEAPQAAPQAAPQEAQAEAQPPQAEAQRAQPAQRPAQERPGPGRSGQRPGRGRGGPRPASAPAPARVYIKSTFNNIIISFTDQQGNVICWASGGSIGFTGTKKGTPFAAGLAAENAGRRAMDKGVGRVDVYCKGPGSARETAIRTLQAIGIEVSEIKDVTPIPHNGCRPKKRRRM